MSHSNKLSILTLNTWLLETPVLPIPIAKDVQKRFKRLPELILQTNADIIFLQEVWKKRFVKQLEKELKPKGFHFAYDQKSILRMGNGLLTISKYPFIKTKNKLVTTKTYRKRTRLDEHAVKKGATMTAITHPNLGELKLFNTHLGATTLNRRSMQPKQNHYESRQYQLMDLAEFIKSNSSNPNNFILAGDFNVNEHQFSNMEYKVKKELDPAYQSILEKLDLIDTYRAVNRNFNPKDERYLGYTVNANSNPYVSEAVNKSFASFGRIDYIFLQKEIQAVVQSSDVVFNSQEREDTISDHFGVLTKLKLTT